MRYIFIICLFVSALFADVRDVVGQGNELFSKGDYVNAQLKYEQALTLDAANEQAMYNLGVTQIKNGQKSDALKTFMSLAGKTADKNLLAKSQRNIAAIQLEDGLKLDQQQQPTTEQIGKKIESLDSSIEYLARAKENQPAEKDNFNRGIEAARLGKVTLEQIKKQIENQEQQQKQSKDDMKDKLDKLQKQQQDLSQQSGEQSKQPQQPQDGKQQQMQQRQQDLTDQTKQAQQQAMQAPPENMEFKESSEKMKEAIDKQQQAQEQLSKGDYKEAEKSQKEAADKLKEAKDSLEKGDENKDQQDQKDKQDDKQQDKQKDGQDKQKEQSDEQKQSDQQSEESKQQQADQQKQIEQAKIDSTAQEILDKEKENRQERIMLRTQRRTVEKDW